MTLNGVMALTLRSFTEFGKPAYQHIGLTALRAHWTYRSKVGFYNT